MLKLIMTLSKISKISNIHPVEKIVLSIFPIIVIGFSEKTTPIFINIIIFVILHLICKNNSKIIIKFTLGITVFAAFSSIAFIFDYGLEYCGVILLRALSAGLSLAFFSLTTPVDDVLSLLAKNNYLKDICDIVKSMERFLLLIYEEGNIIYSSIKSRGGFDRIKPRVVNTGKLAGLLFINTMYRWKDIKEGLDSRGYRGYMPYLKKDFNFSYFRFSLICIYVFFLATVVYIKV